MYMQYHHKVKSLLLHCCPKVGLDLPQGTKRPLRGSICCQHYQDQLEETSNLEKVVRPKLDRPDRLLRPCYTESDARLQLYNILTNTFAQISGKDMLDSLAVGIRGVCTAVRMFFTAAEPQIIFTAVRTLSHVRGWLPVPRDPSSHLTNMVLG